MADKHLTLSLAFFSFLKVKKKRRDLSWILMTFPRQCI